MDFQIFNKTCQICRALSAPELDRVTASERTALEQSRCSRLDVAHLIAHRRQRVVEVQWTLLNVPVALPLALRLRARMFSSMTFAP